MGVVTTYGSFSCQPSYHSHYRSCCCKHIGVARIFAGEYTPLLPQKVMTFLVVVLNIKLTPYILTNHTLLCPKILALGGVDLQLATLN